MKPNKMAAWSILLVDTMVIDSNQKPLTDHYLRALYSVIAFQLFLDWSIPEGDGDLFIPDLDIEI